VIWAGCELITLGVYRHLDGPVIGGSLSRVVIVSGLNRLLVRVLDLLLAKSQKVLYWIVRVIELPHLWVGSCSVHLLDEFHATPLSRRTTKCWLTQWGLVCRQARKPREKNLMSLV
jgi:hypothetical protein